MKAKTDISLSVNGVWYQFKSGDEVNVPQTVVKKLTDMGLLTRVKAKKKEVEQND